MNLLKYWPLEKVLEELTRYNVRHVNDTTECGAGTITTEFIESTLFQLKRVDALLETVADAQADLDGMKQNWQDAKEERDALKKLNRTLLNSLDYTKAENDKLREELEAWKSAAEDERISVHFTQAAQSQEEK